MARVENDDLIKVFQEANETTYKRVGQMDEIYKFLIKNNMLPIHVTKSKKITKIPSKKKEIST